MSDLRSFQKRLGLPLAKMVHADDFTGIRKDVDPEGHKYVDHMPDLSAHPRSMDAKVEEYRKAISNQAPMMRVTPENLHGATAKATYKLVNSTNLPHGKTVLVKPYHEALHPKAKFWQNHPVQGWAEMTNQSLYHAAGLGDLHQQAHVSEHDMGGGFEKQPALVVHMEPDTDYVENLEPGMFDKSMRDDGIKIGIMDFLSNNLDRHVRNLLVRKEGARDEKGGLYGSRLLAIDHSRNFQYHAAHKGSPLFANDPVLGKVPVDSEFQKAYNQKGKEQDNLLFYLGGGRLGSPGALAKLNSAAREQGMKPAWHKDAFVPLVTHWWPEVRDRVISAFADRLRGIKEPRMKEHLMDNFRERVGKLDDIAAYPEKYMKNAHPNGAPNVSDMNVPLKVWNR